MLNKRPIFLHTFSNGGSNLLWNLFQSHPEVVSPIYETGQLFRDPVGRLVTALMTQQLDYWSSIRNLSPRRKAPARFFRFVDRRFFNGKMNNLQHTDNREKKPGVLYTEEEIRDARLVLKCHNAQAFLTDEFARAYPDATFIAMPRDGYALGEAYLRRGRVTSARDFAIRYRAVAMKMLSDSRTLPHYHLVRFEDLFSPSFEVESKAMFEMAGLDYRDLDGLLRFKTKERLPAEEYDRLRSYWNDHGRPDYVIGSKYWIPASDVSTFIDFRINEISHERLKPEDKAVIDEVAGDVLTELGYRS